MRRFVSWIVGSFLSLSAGTAAAEPLRVVTFNAYAMPWITSARAERLRAAAEAIAAFEPHIVALQEIWVDDDARAFAAAMRDAGLPYAAHYASARPAAVGGAGLLIASAFPMRDVAYRPFTVGRHPHTPWHLDWMSRKGIALAMVETPSGELVIANTHLQADYLTASYVPVRLTQVLEVADAIGAPGLDASTGALPAILVGDLNSRPTDVDFELLATAARLDNATPDCELDAVLYRGGENVSLRPRRVERILVEPVTLPDGTVTRLSDHDGLLVELEVARRGDGETALAVDETAPAVNAPAAPSAAIQNARAAVGLALAESRLLSRWAPVAGGLAVWAAMGASVAARRGAWRRRRPWRAMTALFLLAGIYLGYLGLGYASHRALGLEWAARRLMARPTHIASGAAR